MRIVFMGTPEFACPSLSALCGSVVLVVTMPDRPAGRGRKLTPPPVKRLAERLHLPIHQTGDISSEETLKALREAAPDIIVVVAFGAKLPREVLDLPKHGCINLHASLLPRYRGAAPITWAIVRGEKETGVTVFKLTERMDAGPILLQRRVEIPPDWTAGDLHDALARVGAETLAEAVELIETGRARYTPQEERLATYAPMLTKEDAAIDWSRPAPELHNFIRGMTPRPGAYTALLTCKGKERVIIVRTEPRRESKHDCEPGSIVEVNESGLLVAAGEGCILVKSLKPAGKREMSAGEYLRGHSVKPGDRFVSLQSKP